MTAYASSQRRIRMILMVMAVLGVAMFVQLIRVQFGPYAPAFAARESFALERKDELDASRGVIYDRDGRILASNVPMYYLEVEVRQLTPESKKQIAAVLSRALVLPYEDIFRQLVRDWLHEGQVRIRLTREIQDGQPWPITVDQVAADMLNGFLADPEAPDLSGLALVPAPSRTYPSGELAGHVVGFVNQKGEGYFGVEGFYDDWLVGDPVIVEHGTIPLDARPQPDAPTGVNLVLTIDLDIQQMVDAILREAMESSGAESAYAIVMDPRNGELLAMVALPALDPVNYEEWLPEEEKVGWEWVLAEPAVDSEEEAAPQEEAESESSANADAESEETQEEPVINPLVSGVYEPGSTFKVLTMSAALDAERVTPEDIFVDKGVIEVGGHPIKNWDGTAWGPRTMTECMQHSLNVCLAYVASQKLEAPLFYQYLKAFGIGQLTGVDLEGEVAGNLRTPRHPDWTESDLGTNAFGQGVSVTPIQLIAAIAAVPNGGVMMQPHIVRAVAGPETVYWPQPTVLGSPISPEAAAKMNEMLLVSAEGEGRRAALPGYTLAGKTGTAQIPGDNGYDPDLTIASYIGWGPVEAPRFIVLIRFDKPRSSPWGSVVAAPVFHDIVERLVVMMGIPPSSIVQESG
jgi:cell division protein FtsI/penicillin-binding protein 2